MGASTATAATRTPFFHQFGMQECGTVRNGYTQSADGWRHVLDPGHRPIGVHYADRNLEGRFFQADVAFAIPALYERLEEAGYFYAIRLLASNVLRERIAHRLSRPWGGDR